MVDGTSHSGAVHTNNSQSSKYSTPCRAGAGGKAIAMKTISRPKIIGAIPPPPYAQSSPPKPEVEGAQSPPAAHRDDSRAPKPRAGLVHQAHRFTCSRRGWWGAGIFAVVACLAWPNLTSALDPGVTVSETELMVSEGGSASYTVVLDTQPTDDVTITVAPSSGDDKNLTASPETLMFTNSNWSMQQTVTVSAAEDDDSEPGTALFTHTVAGPGTPYDGLTAPGVKATEIDNDPPGVMASETELMVPEGGSASYTVRLVTQPTDDVTITMERVTGDEDLTASPDTLTFTNSNWSMQQTVTILAAEDDDGEAGTAQFGHNVVSPGTVYHGIPAPGVRATEDDNDTIGVIVSPTALSVPEGGSATYTVRLGTQPEEDVTVEATSDHGSDADLTVTSGTDTDADFNSVTLLFTDLNWHTQQTVTVSAAEDADEVDGVAIFSHTTATNGEDYYPLDVDPVTATEADNEKVVTVVIQTEVSAPVRGVFEVTIIFSEAVMGFERSEIAVTNGSVTDFSGSGTTYKAEITPSESGEVTVKVGASVAEYGVGNGNMPSAPLVIEADLDRPEVVITSETTGPVHGAFDVRIRFSESVEGFELEDVRVTNGTASNFTKVSPQEYTATITPEATGEVRVEVRPNVAEDAAGNGNEETALTIKTAVAVSFAALSYTATEGGEAVTVTVQLSQGWDEELAIPIRVTRLQPESTEVDDYTVDGLEEWDAQEGTGKLTFLAGETEQAFTIAANDDEDGEDETLELRFGELPEIAPARELGVATVTLEDKGLVLKVSFGQAAYTVKEGEAAGIQVSVSPTADRQVGVPLVVAPKGGATDEDYRVVSAFVVIEAGESEGTISVKVLADDVNDPGEWIVLSLGELPQGVSAGEPASTEVQFEQRRMAERFSQTLKGMAAVIARSTAVSAQTAIEGRFERHRQWSSRLGSSVGALPTAPPGSDNSAAALSPRATGSGWNSENGETGAPGSWLRSLSLGSLGNLARFDPTHRVVSPGSGMAPSGSVYRQDLDAAGAAPPAPGSGDFSGMRGQAFSLSGVSFELSSGASEAETSRVAVLWGQGDVQRFNGDLSRLGMAYRGGLEAAHVGLDLYANDQMLAGLSFMRSWGDVDYTDDGIDGVLESHMTTFHPYLYWQLNGRLSMWSIGGFGGGQVAVEEPGRAHHFNADFRMLSGGVRAVLSRRGSHEWGLRGDGFTAYLETGASADIAPVSGDAHRGRLLLDWVHDEALSVGRSLSVQVEAGWRFDGGDAERGRGLETGIRLGYQDAHRGLDVALHGRVLVVHASDYRDWGLGVQASWDPGEKQRGFRASLTSSWGRDGGGRTTLWDNADAVMRPAGMGAMEMGSQYRMAGEVAYGGLQALGLAGLLTPYSRWRWGGQGRELALGTAWSLPTGSQQALPLLLELETIRREAQTGPADLAVLARLSLPF